MNSHETIELFGFHWWTANITTGFLVFLIVWWGSRKATAEQIRKASIIIGTILISRAVIIHPAQINQGMWNVQSSLPLQMCAISAWLSGIAMFTRNQKVYEFLYFWGIPGAFHSLLTPEFTISSQGFWFFEYYLSHGGIFLGAFWATFVFGQRPSRGSWWKMFLWTQLTLPVIGGLNYLLDANYMYICEPPIVENPFIIGNFPEHLIGLEFAGLLHFVIVYLPFGLKYRKRARIVSA